MLSVYI